MNPLHKLYCKLCRELAQSERSAVVHTRRESRRLGDSPPAHALLALGSHAAAMRLRFDALMSKRIPGGIGVARRVGEVFSALRYVIFDRMIDVERSYRGTLLGFHHGLSCARLLRDVARKLGDRHLVAFCNDWLEERTRLVEAAEQELSWFAEAPRKAIASGLRVAFEPAPD